MFPHFQVRAFSGPAFLTPSPPPAPPPRNQLPVFNVVAWLRASALLRELSVIETFLVRVGPKLLNFVTRLKPYISAMDVGLLTLYTPKVIIVPHRTIRSWNTLAVDGWGVTFGTARRGLLAVPNVTAHPSTASVPITIAI